MDLDSSALSALFVLSTVKGDLKEVTRLLRDPSLDVNALDGEGMSALHWAAAYNEAKMVKLLLDHPLIDPNALGRRKMTPLHKAAVGGSLGALEILLSDPRVEVDAANCWEETPLFLAAHNGDFGICFSLLQSGACQNVTDRWGNSPADVAADHGFPRLKEMLLDFVEGLESSFISNYSCPVTPTSSSTISQKVAGRSLSKMMEAPLSDEDFLGWLEDESINVNGADMYRWTALHKLAAWNKVDCLTALLNCPGLEPDVPRGQSGDLPLHSAIEMGAFQCVNVLLEFETHRQMINVGNDEGSTPLHHAVLTGNSELVKKLLDLNANPSIRRGRDQLSPWHLSRSLPDEYRNEMSPILWEALQRRGEEELPIMTEVAPPSAGSLPQHYGQQERQISPLTSEQLGQAQLLFGPPMRK